MKYFLFFLFLPILSFAQELKQWELKTPVKHASKFIAVEAVGNNTFYVLEAHSNRGEILKSINNGASWNRISYSGFAAYGDMHMFDENKGLISVRTKIYYTENGFEEIEEVQALLYNIQDFYFVDTLIAYSVGDNGSIAKTTDGGQTWELQESNTPHDLKKVHFLDENTGFACGWDSIVLKTEDGGLTWTNLSVGENSRWEAIYFSDAQQGLIVGLYGELKYTTDGGLTWLNGNFETDNDLHAIEFFNNELLVLGEGGLILNSVDNGINWTARSYGFDRFFSIGFNGNTGIIGGDHIIYESSNFGEDWSLNQDNIQNTVLESVDFADENHGVAVGNGATTSVGGLVTTDDGGETWTRYNNSTYYDVHLLEDGNGIISTGNGSYSLTSDYGTNWTPRPSAGPVAGLACWMHNAEEYIIGGGNGIGIFTGIYNTNNNGASWIYSDTYIIDDFYFPSREIGYGAGEGNRVYKTTDGGDTWNEAGGISPNNYTVFFLDNDMGFVGGLQGIWKTIDGGENWDYLGSTGACVEVYFYNEMVGYYVSPQGYVLNTRDGGQTWTYIVGQYLNQTLTDAHFFENKIIAVGRNADIFSVEITPVVRAYQANNLVLCDENNSGDEMELFDLTSVEAQIINQQTEVSVTYYRAAADAVNSVDSIENLVQFENTSPTQTIYVRVDDLNSDDYDTTSFQLIVQPLPQSNAAVTPYEVCPGTIDHLGDFDLTTKVEEILDGQDPSLFDVSFYYTLVDALVGSDSILSPQTFTNVSNPQVIHVGVSNIITGCYQAGVSFFTVRVQERPEIMIAPDDILITDDVDDELAIFDLTVNEAQILGTQNEDDFVFTYHKSMLDAEENMDAIEEETMYQNTQNPQTIFVRFTNFINGCYKITSFDIEAGFVSSVVDLEFNVFQLSPNPNAGIFRLKSNVSAQPTNIQVFDVHGQLIHYTINQSNSEFVEIDLLDNQAGIYFVKIRAEERDFFIKIIRM